VLVGTLSVALATLLALWLAGSITRPVEDLTRASERMARGEYDVRVPVHRDDEIGHLAATFNTMSQEVGEAQRRQRDFVANVSHDLRTPLTSIRGFAGALVDGTARSDAQRQHAAQAIDEAAARMTTLVNTLLDLARLEGHHAGLELAPTRLDDVLQAVLAASRPAATLRQVRFEADGAAGLNVAADATWLVRALGNVVENAVHYSPVGGAVRLTAREAGDWVIIAVSDDGPGIPAEDLPRVFERFYRGDKARPAGGSGLGLAIAREIVEAHGGDITIASPPGAGTTVTTRLRKA
jgi:signal transduction histidine kinase